MINKNSKTLLFFFILIISHGISAQTSFNTEKIITGNYNEERVLKINVSKKENMLYSVVKKLPPHFSVPKMEILHNGYLMLIHSLEGIVEFYNLNGDKILEKNYYKLPPYNEQKLLYSIYDNGTALLISENNLNKIILIDNNGNQIFEKEISKGIVESFTLSSNAQLLAYSIINWDGNNVEYNPSLYSIAKDQYFKLSSNFRRGEFNSDNSLFIGFNKREVFCTNIDDSKVVWNKTFNENEIVLDAAIDGEDVIILKSGRPIFQNNKWQYNNTSVISKNIQGEELVVKTITENVEEIRIQKEGAVLNLRTNRGVFKIK